MKKIFVMAALAMAAISCTKSDVLESPVLDQPINFFTYLGRTPVTKGNYVTIDDMKTIGFDVKALKCVAETTTTTGEGDDATTTTTTTIVEGFDATPYMHVKLTASGTGWQYVEAEGDNAGKAINYYWPTNTSEKLVFVGYGLNASGTFTTGTGEAASTEEYIKFANGSNTDFTYTVPTTIADHKDLIVTNTEICDQDNCENGVALNFEHLLSRIDFAITSNGGNSQEGEGGTLPVHIKDLSLKGKFVQTGNVSLASIADGKLNGKKLTPGSAAEEAFKYEVISETKTFYTKTEQPIFAGAETDAANRYMMIIPQSTENVTIEGTYTIDEDPTERTISINLGASELKNFEAGKAYKFVLNVKTSVISFSVTVEPWKEKVLDENGQETEIFIGDTFEI